MKKGAVFNDAFLVCHEIYIAARFAGDSFPHALPRRSRTRDRAAPAWLIRAHVVGLGRGDSTVRRRGTDPRTHLSAGALFPPGGDAACVDQRCIRSENG